MEDLREQGPYTSAPTPPWAKVPPIPKPQVARLDAALADAGYALFDAYACSSCHGHGGEALGATTTDLRLRPPLTAEYLQMSVSGVLKSRGMPAFDLTGDEVKALHAYLVNAAWNAYEAQQQAASADEGLPVGQDPD